MAYKLTEIVADIYARHLATKGLTALTGGTSKVAAVIITNGGSGYIGVPTVGFTGGGAAAGTAVLSNGAVVAVIITNTGTGYTSVPSVSFTPTNGGAGAAGTALMEPETLDAITTTDKAPGFLATLAYAGDFYPYQLASGTDAENPPLVVRPDDYAGGTNEKVWKLMAIIPAVGTPGVSMWSQSADVACTDATSDTDLLGSGIGSRSLLSADWFVGKQYRLRASGHWTTAKLKTIEFKVKIGSTTIATSGAWTPDVDATNRAWRLDVDITCRTTGAGGTVMVNGYLHLMNDGFPIVAELFSASAVSVDLSTDKTLAFTAVFGSGTAGEHVTGTQSSITPIN